MSFFAARKIPLLLPHLFIRGFLLALLVEMTGKNKTYFIKSIYSNYAINQILTASNRIVRTSKGIFEPDDFLISDDGIDKLDAICIMLIAIGENLKAWVCSLILALNIRIDLL